MYTNTGVYIQNYVQISGNSPCDCIPYVDPVLIGLTVVNGVGESGISEFRIISDCCGGVWTFFTQSQSTHFVITNVEQVGAQTWRIYWTYDGTILEPSIYHVQWLLQNTDCPGPVQIVLLPINFTVGNPPCSFTFFPPFPVIASNIYPQIAKFGTLLSPIVVTPDVCCTEIISLSVNPSLNNPPPNDWIVNIISYGINLWGVDVNMPTNPGSGTYEYIGTFSGCTFSTPNQTFPITIIVP